MSEVNPQLQRLRDLQVNLDNPEAYLLAPDSLGEVLPEAVLPVGYKRCGGCHQGLKYYLFNKNNGSKTGLTGNCKECQKKAARASYDKNKGKQDYKQYYQEHREQKLAHSRRIYQENKDAINARHKEYHKTAAGKRVMRKAHAKRRKAISANSGVAYKREWVIDRDMQGGEFPICYLCGEPITVETAMHKDHVVPIALGGMDCFTNVAMVHAFCNLQKEKDARKLKASQVEFVIKLAEKYIQEHPELFEEG